MEVSRGSMLRGKLRSRFCSGMALTPPFLPAVLLHGSHELHVCTCHVDRAAAGLDEVGAVILARGTAALPVFVDVYASTFVEDPEKAHRLTGHST